jgi:hypothetical protein
MDATEIAKLPAYQETMRELEAAKHQPPVEKTIG